MHFYALSAADAEIAIAKYRERFSAIGLFENEVYAGIPEMLQKLASDGHILTVATSKPTVYALSLIHI